MSFPGLFNSKIVAIVIAVTSQLLLNAPAHAERNGLPPITLDDFVYGSLGIKKVAPETAQKARDRVLKSLPIPILEKAKIIRVDVLEPSTAFDELILDASITAETDVKPDFIEMFYLDWFEKNSWMVWSDKQETSETRKVFEARNKAESPRHKWTLSIDQNFDAQTRQYSIDFRKSSALDVVGKSRILYDAAVGDGGDKPYEFSCYKLLLLNGKDHWSDFEKMLKTGTPAGRVYAAVLLYKTDKPKALPLIEPLLKDTTSLPMQSGCLILDTTIQKEVENLLDTGDIFTFDEIRR